MLKNKTIFLATAAITFIGTSFSNPSIFAAGITCEDAYYSCQGALMKMSLPFDLQYCLAQCTECINVCTGPQKAECQSLYHECSQLNKKSN